MLRRKSQSANRKYGQKKNRCSTFVRGGHDGCRITAIGAHLPCLSSPNLVESRSIAFHARGSPAHQEVPAMKFPRPVLFPVAAAAIAIVLAGLPAGVRPASAAPHGKGSNGNPGIAPPNS